MRDTKNVFTFGLFIVILLALAFVFLNQPGSAPQARLAQEPGLIAPETPQASTLEELKEQEILGLAGGGVSGKILKIKTGKRR